MKKLIAIFFCMGLLTACDSESAKKDSASDTNKIEASQTQVSTASATPTEMVSASSPTSGPADAQPDSDLRSEVERVVQEAQEQLPININGVDATNIELENNTLHYSLTVTEEKLTNQKISITRLKEHLILTLCGQPDTKRVILGGYDFLFTYHYPDKSKVEINVSAQDCQ